MKRCEKENCFNLKPSPLSNLFGWDGWIGESQEIGWLGLRREAGDVLKSSSTSTTTTTSFLTHSLLFFSSHTINPRILPRPHSEFGLSKFTSDIPHYYQGVTTVIGPDRSSIQHSPHPTLLPSIASIPCQQRALPISNFKFRKNIPRISPLGNNPSIAGIRRSSFAMRPFSSIPIISWLLVLLNLGSIVFATPLSLEDEQSGLLDKRECSNPCGYYSQLCCNTGETCTTTSGGQAKCVSGSSDSSGSSDEWEYYTTTYVVTETDKSTITSVWSSRAHAATGSSSGTCRIDLGESKCGTTCCDAAQECQDGECVAESSSAIATGTEATGEATPGVRGTSASTVTETSAPTTTEGFTAPVGTNGADLIGAKAAEHKGGLSGGAIAGIVIGTIAGVVLLLLLCGCLCFKGALDGLLAALGIRKRRRNETTYVEERYSHHSGSRPRPRPSGGRTWFGTRPPAGSDSELSEKKKSKWSGWGTVAIILGALALCLGLKRHRDQEHDDDRSSYTYPSSYYYSDTYTYSGSKFFPIEPMEHGNRTGC